MQDILKPLKSALWFAPAVTLLLVIFCYPVLRTILLSFLRFDLETGFQPQFAGLVNFIRLASDSRFFASLKTTVLFTVASVTLEFFLGLTAALAVESLHRAGRSARTFLLTQILHLAVLLRG